MIDLGEKRVVVVVEDLIRRLGLKPQRYPGRVEQCQIVEDYLREAVGLLPHLSFIVAEEERPVDRDGSAERDAELVLVERILAGAVENGPGGQRVVHPEVVRGAAPLVGPGLGHDVDEPAKGAAVFREIG